MKKIFSLLVALFFVRVAFAVTDLSGHFHYDLAARQLPVTSGSSYFYEYLDLPENTTFLQVRDTMDIIGYRHLTFVQYVDNVLVEGGMVLVHAYNDLVLSINGDVRTAAQVTPSSSDNLLVSARQALRKVGRATHDESQAKLVYVKVMQGDTFAYRRAYRVRSNDYSRYEYVDAETGEIIKTTSLLYTADVQGTAHTMYNGVVPFTCYQDPKDGNYLLFDSARHIVTLDATHATPIDHEQVQNWGDVVHVLMEECDAFENTSSDWNLTYHRYLTKFAVFQLDAWQPEEEGELPDLFVRIYNGFDSLLYTTDTIENVDLSDVEHNEPAVFYVPDGVEALDGRLHLYFYNAKSTDSNSLICDYMVTAAFSCGNVTFSAPDTILGALHYEEVGAQPALDVHWGMQKTIDFYRTKLHRNSYDDHDGVVYQFYNPQYDNVYFSTMPNNAFAFFVDTIYFMVYGVGMTIFENPSSIRPLVDIDVMSHEFTHLVTMCNGNGGLAYEDESGALNESFSDLMAMGVLQYVKDTCTWSIGQNLMLYADEMRSLSDPNKTRHPKYYQGQYWATLGDYSQYGDYGGVHTNSGVQNHWFYLLCHGGSGTNEAGDAYNVTGIGVEKGIQIAYMNLLYYLPYYACYSDARWGSEQAAKELYGENSQEYQSVVAAWDAVGVDEKTYPVPTAIATPHLAPAASKRLQNGQILIIREGKIYDLVGREI